MKVTAYIPCYNNRETILKAIASIRAQTRPVDELFVVDDGSTDGSAELVESAGVRVIRMNRNAGRGAARSRATKEAKGDLILGCDGTNTLREDFLERAIKILSEKSVVGVYGRLIPKNPSKRTADLWRDRHLLKMTDWDRVTQANRAFCSWAYLLNRQSTLDVGNFDPSLRACEDSDLGKRLAANGHIVLSVPDLVAYTEQQTSVRAVLERFCRWYIEPQETGKNKLVLNLSIKVLIRKDLKEGDYSSALLSLILPLYYIFLRNKR